MREAVLRAKPLDARAATALDLLSRWNGDAASSSAAAALFELFSAEMTRRLVEAKAPRSSPWALGMGTTPISPRSGFLLRASGRLSRLLSAKPAGWFEKPWPEVVSEALSAAADTLAKRCGPDPADWAWGRARRLRIGHPFGKKAAFRPIFDRGPYPSAGDTNTVAQASLDLFEPLAGPMYTASLRAVMDVGRWERSRFALPGGQSGNPLSPHYDDQLPLWLAGSGIPIPWTEEEVSAAARDELVLVPRT
jgi:penicillin amidase